MSHAVGTRRSQVGLGRSALVLFLVFLLVVSILPVTLLSTAPTDRLADSRFPTAKIDSRLLNVTSSNRPVDVLVSYDGPAGEFKTRAALSMIDESAELVKVYKDINMMRVRMMASRIPALAREAFIRGIWSNEPLNVSSRVIDSSTATTSSDYVSPVDLLGVKDLWEQGYNGSGVVVAVLDTGIDFLHPDLDDLDDNSSTLDPKVTAFASFVEGDTLPVDIIGHGTYVASIIGGTGNKSDGAYAGIAPGVTMLSAKVTLGGLLAAPSWIVSGIEWACSRGADIIVLPFNTFGAPGDAVSEAVQAAAERGVLVIAAAGDDGPDYLTIMSPGGTMSALTVGAYDPVNQEVPPFSGRGRSLEMMTKPDLVAPGVGIVGARVGGGLQDMGFGGFSLEDVGSIANLLGGSLGEPIDDYYVRADTTAASAAIVAGAAAILLQAFDRATPIVVGNVFRDTATPLDYDANDAGAGLLNLRAAFDYLRTRQGPVESQARTTGIPLLATGIVMADSQGANTTVMMSSYGTTIVALDQRDATSSLHLLLGMFALRWNNMDPTNLMMFDVEREMHQVYAASLLDNYNRYVGILSYEHSVYVILVVESYNLTLSTPEPLTGIKITPFILNMGDQPIDNVSLFLSYSLDLFLDGRDDHGKYALGNQELFVYGQSEDYNDFYFGLNSSRPLGAFEVGNASTISSHISNDNLTGSTSFDGSVGLGMRWDFDPLAPGETANVTIAMGFGDNRTILDRSIETMWQLQPSPTLRQQGDLIVVQADIPRVAQMGHTYTSHAIVMNIGVETSPVVAAMIIGHRNGTQQGTLFTSFHSFEDVKPFHAVRLTVEWSPEREGLFSAAWVAAVSIASAIALFSNPAGTIATTGAALLDDFLVRDLFVVTPISSISVFPRRLPSAPFNLRFPADFGMYGLMVTSTEPLGNLTVTKHGNATDWGNVTLTPSDNVQGYYNFSLVLFVPVIAMDGYFSCDYVIHTEHGWSASVTLGTTIRYARAMVFLDSTHGGGLGALGGFSAGNETPMASMGGDGGFGGGGGIGFPLAADDTDTSGSSISGGDIGSVSESEGFLESIRLTTFSGLSTLKTTMAERLVDLVEFPGVTPTEDLLMLFSGYMIIRPLKEFNSTEIDLIRDFSASGGKLIVFGDSPDRANITAINLLLAPYGYAMNGTVTAENTTEIVDDSRLGQGLECVWLGGGTYILNNQSLGQVMWEGRPVVLLDDSPPEIALFGSSRLFMNKYLPHCNNTLLLDNLIEFLLDNTLTCTTTLAENTTHYPVGRSVFINLQILDYHGNPVNDLTVVVIFQLPNGSQSFFFAGFVENGLYTSQFAPSYWRDEGRINGIFFILRTEEYAGTFASISFWFYRPPSTNSTATEGWKLTMPQVAVITAISIFGGVLAALVWNRARRKRRLRVPEVDTTLAQDIDNTLNRLLAAFVQIEELIRQEDLDRIQKVETVRGMMRVLDKAVEEFEKVSDRVGGV
ncbi:MAG: S8 family serine peptidase [Candidatus Thorarchaeota archaeon]